MTTASVRIVGLEQLMEKVESLADLRAVKAGLMAGAGYLKGKAEVYPPVKRLKLGQVYGFKQFKDDAGPFKTGRQRRWFFAALRSGQITVPYVRTTTLQQKWALKKRNQGLTIIVGNNTPYGPLVMDKDQQSKMHKAIGWNTIQRIAEKEGPEVVKMVKKEVDKLLEA